MVKTEADSPRKISPNTKTSKTLCWMLLAKAKCPANSLPMFGNVALKVLLKKFSKNLNPTKSSTLPKWLKRNLFLVTVV